jgi:hypothetical protein
MLVDLIDVTAGDILRVELLRENGKVLIPKATVLSKPLLSGLRKRGVSRIDIEAPPGTPMGGLDRDEAVQLIDKRFSLVTDDPFMQALRRHTLIALTGLDPEEDDDVRESATRTLSSGEIEEALDGDV